MTSIAGASSAYNMPFDRSIFSNPEMRPHLEDYYEASYAPMRERIAGMKEAEANGEATRTIAFEDGQIGTELSAEQYESMIPSFDKWLEMQQNFSAFDMLEQSGDMLAHAEAAAARAERDLNPDLPSGVRTVFSDGDRILGYINKDGSLVTHEGGEALQSLAAGADALNLTGEARIAYLTKNGTAMLSRQHANLATTSYSDATMPTRREFAAKWYPDHDVDAAYESMLEDIRTSLAGRQSWHKQQMSNIAEMRAYLISSMQEAEVS
ncbi:hypothetical protein [Gimibacter soli]|uniref:Uncharacterized protein n=1 Tax=Gimibacter soli TaxID=3024400 RepID=A0AAF0BKN9_9PROT|nr:hypothetical protein [Gimibacter soli]WCL54494.1 hypothetical protein PH603_01825 [Gimibacter soli]